jgi:hypothetical protein
VAGGLDCSPLPPTAGFGGFLGRKSDGHPGPKALGEGMQRVRELAIALEAGKAAYARESLNKPCFGGGLPKK